MKIANKFALACIGALALGTSLASTGCAADRPLRNGVPNEQLYLKKSFIIRPGAAGSKDHPSQDDGWMVKATVMKTDTPNPLGQVLFTGAENNGMLLRFVATSDHLQLVNLREFSDSPEIAAQDTRTPEVVNSWSAEHGDLKLAVTPDGEKTNRFEVNQELPWDQRQWVHVNLARGDLGDFALFGSEITARLGKCAGGGASATVVPNSIIVDEDSDYIEWMTNVTIPVNFSDAACVESFGEAGDNFARMGRSNVTVDLKYSMMRAKPLEQVTYKPLELAEKDPIRRKYGPIMQTTWARDPQTQQVAAREFAVRFDPNKDIVLYFAEGYPEEYKSFFNGPNGIVEQTNAIFEKNGVKARLVVKNFDQDLDKAPAWEKKRGRKYGDVRYNFIRWMSDQDVGADFIGVEQFVPDPRTGEALSASVNIADFPLREFVAQRVDAFLQTIMCRAAAASQDDSALPEECGKYTSDAPWGAPLEQYKNADGKTMFRSLPDTCTPGQTAPLLPAELADSYGHSSLFSKMQEYMGDSVEEFGHLGPRSFTAEQDEDFHKAYYKLIPYYLFADPATNQFVKNVTDTGAFGGDDQYKALQKMADFHKLTADVDRGVEPFKLTGGPEFIDQALAFADNIGAGLQARNEYEYKKQFVLKSTTKRDEANDVISFTGVMQKAGRHCVDGHWETREEWMKNLETTYHALTVWHEFGHLLGMNHNFLASVDKPNYPSYTDPNCDPATDSTKCVRVGMYSSSVMEYSATPDRIFWSNESGSPGWAPYDRGAIAWIYANEGSLSDEQIKAAAAQAATTPPKFVSGQLSPTMPWKDPEGFTADGTEREFLYCNEAHEKYSPICRTGDFGSTPSEIIANELESYEWQYQWRNFRKYRKVWDLHNYADIPAKEIVELRRFLPMWANDWTGDKLRDDFGRIGVEAPANLGAVSREQYMKQLASKFDNEMSTANQIVAAFHLAVIAQSTGERPYATIIDKYFGDVTQQGIILDKVFAMQGWVGLWQSKNYDPNQDGQTLSSFASVGDEQYQGIAQRAVTAMLGEDTYASYPYLKATAVTLFARDTQSLAFSSFAGSNIDMRDWIGSKVFSREQDMLDYFRKLAIDAEALPELGCAHGNGSTLADDQMPTLETCKYDPTLHQQKAEDLHYSDSYNEFVLDNHRYAWMKIRDRNQYVFVNRDRNTTFYRFIRTFNENVTKKHDESRAYEFETQIKYTVDSFHKFNDGNY